MSLSFLPTLLVISLMGSCLEIEISAPSFPDITKGLFTSETLVGMTLSYNLFGFCLASIIWGPLSDRFGRRRIMLIGNAILALAALGCAFTPSINWLLVTRFIQGLGASTSAVVVAAIIADIYHDQEATKFHGLINALFTTLLALAPVFGGFINSAIGWRGNYGSIAVLCCIAWFLLYFFLPETKATYERISVKEISKNFLSLASSPIFLMASTIPSLCYAIHMVVVGIAPFLYMETFQLSIFVYTLHQAIMIIPFALTSFCVGKIIHRLGTKASVYLGLIIYLIGGSLLLVFHSSPSEITFALSLCGIGSAIFFPIIFAKSLEIYPHIKGIASSAIINMRYLLGAGMAAIASYFYNGTPFVLSWIVFSIIIFILFLSIFLLKSPLFQPFKGLTHDTP